MSRSKWLSVREWADWHGLTVGEVRKSIDKGLFRDLDMVRVATPYGAQWRILATAKRSMRMTPRLHGVKSPSSAETRDEFDWRFECIAEHLRAYPTARALYWRWLLKALDDVYTRRALCDRVGLPYEGDGWLNAHKGLTAAQQDACLALADEYLERRDPKLDRSSMLAAAAESRQPLSGMLSVAPIRRGQVWS